MIMPVETAAPIAVLVSITVAAVVLLQDWRKVHLSSAGWLIVSTLVGTPLGLLLLTHVDSRIVKAILGSVIIVFAAYSLMRRHQLELKDDRFAWMFGFIAGILGGAYGMNGPPLVMYGGLRGWSRQHFRATLQGYFLPASIASLLGYWFSGLWTSVVTHDYLLSVPVLIIAIFLGRIADHPIKDARFFGCRTCAS